jgi:hypothetical protein
MPPPRRPLTAVTERPIRGMDRAFQLVTMEVIGTRGQWIA